MAELIEWALPALKITAIGLVLVWLAPFLFSELVEKLQKPYRRALPKDGYHERAQTEPTVLSSASATWFPLPAWEVITAVTGIRQRVSKRVHGVTT